jgi:hypothetical protein
MTDGYIYCFSNPSMPDILSIGITTNTPNDMARELFTPGVALPFKIEFAKKVTNPSDKVSKIHLLLGKYTTKVCLDRDFFRISPEDVRVIFDIMDGDMWAGEGVGMEVVEMVHAKEPVSQTPPSKVKGCRVMKKCFSDGQEIRHTIKKINDTWIGTFDLARNAIVRDGIAYMSMSAFATGHYASNRPERKNSDSNGWKECECMVNEKWVSTDSLPVLV